MTLRYVGIRVTDLDRSLTFYREGLDLIETARGAMNHGGRFVQLEDPESRQALELNWYPPGNPHATPFVPGEGLDHLGVEVTDFWAVWDRLLRRGAQVAIAPWIEVGRPRSYLIGFVTDPDGHWIEVQGPLPALPG
ncbi:MAG: VOC family protein [Thermoplasmata archaeon]|nr:VOC family protein [Thermoplasmata archaeon]